MGQWNKNSYYSNLVYDIFKYVMFPFQIAYMKLIRFRIRMYWDEC